MTITVIAFGSRGDVQPYAALVVALRAAGHEACLAATDSFAALAAETGAPFRSLGPFSPQELARRPDVQAAVRRGGQLGGLLAIMRASRPLMASILEGCWRVTADAHGVVIPSIPFGALDSALARDLPAVSAPLHSFTPTRAFPSPFFAPFGLRLNAPENRLTYHVMRGVLWAMLGGELNRWRQSIGLPATARRHFFAELDSARIPTVYGFSAAVLPAPRDLPPWHHVSGYWFLNAPTNYQPPAALARFLASGPKPIAIGFGSMDDQRPEERTQVVLEALRSTGRRAILLAGWGGFTEAALPPNVCLVDAASHSWLFPQMAAVVHHGGAGTTAAALRAGVPSVIAPFGGDQPFWARRLVQLGVGVQGEPLTRLTAAGLADAVEHATGDTRLRRRAAALGEVIQGEGGAERAAAIIAQAMGIQR